MKHDIVKKGFYLTSIFSNIKSKNSWSINEIKVVLLLFKELSNYKIYLPNIIELDSFEYDFKEALAKVPREISFSRTEFSSVTGVKSNHLAREINKVRESLVGKVIHTPDPSDPTNDKSGISMPWFSRIEYSDRKGIILVKINEEVIERLVAFVKYTKISFDNIIKIKNNHSIYFYLFIKIIIDTSLKKELILDIEEFKIKLGLLHKYRDNNRLKEKVLDVISEEVNKHTDINFDYEFIKEGRSFTKIKFTFDYKPEYLEKKAKSKSKQQKIPQMIENAQSDDYNSPFEQILVGWNIRARKVVEIEETYSLDVIQSAIDKTLEKEKAGEIKTTKAAIFLGILENKKLASDEQFEREQTVAREEQEKILKKQLADEYDAIQKVINDNADEISNYLSARSINATYEIASELNEQLLNMSCVDAEKFKEFRPKLPVLHNGYYDMKNKKEVSPNMYQFIFLIKRYNI